MGARFSIEDGEGTLFFTTRGWMTCHYGSSSLPFLPFAPILPRWWPRWSIMGPGTSRSGAHSDRPRRQLGMSSGLSSRTQCQGAGSDLLATFTIRDLLREVGLSGPIHRASQSVGGPLMEVPDRAEDQGLRLAVTQEPPTLRGGGFETTWAGGRLMYVMWDPRDGNPHLLRLSHGPVYVELYR